MSSPVSPELAAQIAEWRRKATDGTLSFKEMKDAIIALRAGRVNAQNASAEARRKKAIVEIPKAEDMLSDLENM